MSNICILDLYKLSAFIQQTDFSFLNIGVRDLDRTIKCDQNTTLAITNLVTVLLSPPWVFNKLPNCLSFQYKSACLAAA